MFTSHKIYNQVRSMNIVMWMKIIKLPIFTLLKICYQILIDEIWHFEKNSFHLLMFHCNAKVEIYKMLLFENCYNFRIVTLFKIWNAFTGEQTDNGYYMYWFATLIKILRKFFDFSQILSLSSIFGCQVDFFVLDNEEWCFA